MIIISYDISDDKLRTKFSKFLEKYGHRIQYSVFEIDNSAKILENMITVIKNKFEKRFTESDSIIIIELSATCKVTKLGYAKHQDSDFIIV